MSDKSKRYRIGQIVPSSNVTMETEIPAMLRAREEILPERFTFHSSRMRMKTVSKEELAAMDGQSDRCAAELADARVDVMGYACLVAIMSMGKGYHRESETRLTACVKDNDCDATIVTSAGALIQGIQALGVSKVAIVTPYMKPLTQMVVDYIEAEGIQVVDSIALEIPDNLDVAAHNPENLKRIYKDLKLQGAEAIVLSACVQMPSLSAISFVEEDSGLPVLSAAVSTTYCMLKALGLETRVPNAGALLSGRY